MVIILRVISLPIMSRNTCTKPDNCSVFAVAANRLFAISYAAAIKVLAKRSQYFLFTVGCQAILPTVQARTEHVPAAMAT